MKIQDITPAEMSCAIGACPAIFRTDRDTLLVIGQTVSSDEAQRLAPGRVGLKECMVEVPLQLLQDLARE